MSEYAATVAYIVHHIHKSHGRVLPILFRVHNIMEQRPDRSELERETYSLLCLMQCIRICVFHSLIQETTNTNTYQRPPLALMQRYFDGGIQKRIYTTSLYGDRSVGKRRKS